MANDDKANRYVISGMAAFLPGMQYMVERMQRELDEFRAEVAALQHGEAVAFGVAIGEPAAKRKRGRPKGIAAKSAWSGMTPEERSIEMKRRMAVAKRKKQATSLHPRDKAHPDHEAWLKIMRAANKKMWAKLSPKQRKARAVKAAAARTASAAAKTETARSTIEQIRKAS